MKKAALAIWVMMLVLALAVCAVLIFFPGNGRQNTTPTQALSTPTLTPTEPPETTEEIPVTTEPAPTEPDPVMLEAMDLVQDMTQHEKLCQLLVTTPEALTKVQAATIAGSLTEEALQAYPVGGFILSQKNIENPGQITEMLSGIQDFAITDMLLCVDEEGGSVWRVMGNPNFDVNKLEAMYSYKDQGPDTAYDNARTVAEDLMGLGFNTDFAPVADVWSNPDNKVIGDRAYSDDYAQAAELVAAAVEGFHEGGIICTLKHFPGHGGTFEDSHRELAHVDLTLEELRQGELLPFISGIEAGADMVMVGHIMNENLDEAMPASLSYATVTELLREDLGFIGVVITDGLEMGALSSYSDGEKAVLALQAGCDLLLGLEDVPGTLEAIQKAIDNGELSQERIDESVARILAMKLRYNIMTAE